MEVVKEIETEDIVDKNECEDNNSELNSNHEIQEGRGTPRKDTCLLPITFKKLVRSIICKVRFQLFV